MLFNLDISRFSFRGTTSKHVHTAAGAIANLSGCCEVQARRIFQGKVHWFDEPIVASEDIGFHGIYNKHRFS